MRRFIASLSIAAACTPAWAAQDAGSPRLNFILHCAGCHRQDGMGNPGNGIPGFVGNLGHFLKVPGGREFIIQVPGTAHSPLSDAETADLMNWMLKTFSPNETPAGARPFTTQEVKGLRRHPMVDVPGRRDEITKRLHDEHGVDLREYR